jgi:cytoskeletal protein CcmA (bactofilin family)
VARLGPSLVIKGTLTGEEDLLFEGRLDGEIRLGTNRVTIGENGRIKADVFSKSIYVEGEVQGNLFGEDEVVIRRSGKVRGNVTAPRVTLENGSKFKGSIDMQPSTEKPAVGAGAPKSQKDEKKDSAPVGQQPQAGGAAQSDNRASGTQKRRAGGAG